MNEDECLPEYQVQKRDLNVLREVRENVREFPMKSSVHIEYLALDLRQCAYY